MQAGVSSGNLDYYFALPLIDPEVPVSSTGGYPWSVGQFDSTLVYLKNTTPVPQKYALQLSFPGGGLLDGYSNAGTECHRRNRRKGAS